ncbi:hypothetical protein ACIQWI_04890 [Peribacillus frigoritolerans]
MKRRNFLRNTLLFIFAFLFGYRVNKDDDTVVSDYDYSKLNGKLDSKELNAKYPPSNLIGLKGVGDETEVLENIINFAYKNGYSSVYIPAGSFSVRYINYRDSVYLLGAGVDKTFINAFRSEEKVFMRNIDSPTQQIVVSDFTLNGGQVNEGQHGLGLIGIPLQKPPYHGGVWYSVFKNLKIRNFKGSQIIIKQGEKEQLADSSLPNQFNLFENVQTYRVAMPDSYCLYVKKQVGQTSFRNCQFDCPTNGVKTIGTNIYIDGGNTIIFDTVTSQNSEKAIEILNNKNTSIKNSWFENIKYAITTNAVTNLVIESVNFSNACSDGAGTGYGVKNLSSSDSISIRSCIFAGDVDWSVWGDNNSLEIKTSDLQGNVLTKGITVQRNAVEGLKLGNAKLRYLNNVGNTISNFAVTNSTPNEMVTIKFNGLNKSTILTNKGNISLPFGVNSLTFDHGDCATFMYSTIESKWLLVSHNKLTSL